jgi:hypothetical protein
MTHPTDFRDDHLTNGRRAALALDAINAYAQSGPEEGPDEDHFFFGYEGGADPGVDQDQLSALLSGLMHYAEYRGLGFNAAFRCARRDYQRQRTAYLPGDAVRRALSDGVPLVGEIIKARPGRPPSYQVDFITCREWLAESSLAPAPHFMIIPTGFGNLSSAHVARYCLNRIVTEIEDGYRKGIRPAERAIGDLHVILGALSNWAGVARAALLRSFSEVITETDGWLVAGSGGAHPVRLAAVDVPVLLPPDGRHLREDGR